MKNLRLGEILMEAGTIDRQQLEAALAYQQSHRDLPIGQALVALGFATQAQVTGALACAAGLLDRPEPVAARELVSGFAWDKIPQHDLFLPDVFREGR